ncbi:MAG: insulinase family protein [Holosporaceae bacterium]|jgi:predicted Zn-dependent peptidase|nr:insulinase family protein [Holosporaceae bacterium]
MNNIKLTHLPNGIRVVTKNVESFESVVLGYWIEAGGVCEDDSNCGVSHFLEHMAFKGTISRTAQQIAEEIESVGGYLNAYTSKEITAFHVKVLRNDIGIAIDIVSDILQNPTFLREELEIERKVVLQEINQTHDTPDDIIFDHFQSVAFAKQSMGYSILGPVAVISSLGADDLRNYMGRYYNADNIVFAAVGNIDHDEIIGIASQYFFKFSPQKTIKHHKCYNYVGGSYADIRDLEQVHVIIGFDGVAVLDKDYYTMAIFSSILGGGMSSRLFQEVREKRGLVYAIYSFSSCYKNNGIFGIYAATSVDKLSELSDVVMAEALKIQHDISEKEFNRTKAQFKSSLLMSGESSSSSCEQIVNQTIAFGRPLEQAEILKKIDSVSMDDVKRLCTKVMSSPPSVVTVGKCDCSSIIASLDRNGLKAAS